MAELLRLRSWHVQEILGCGKSYVQSLVKRGILPAHKESSRFVWYARDDVMRLCGIEALEEQKAEPVAGIVQQDEPKIQQIIDAPAKRRRGRPRKQSVEG